MFPRPPHGEDLIVEVMIPNRDVGVRPGMRAIVKLEAHPVIRRGSLTGW